MDAGKIAEGSSKLVGRGELDAGNSAWDAS
jgi:hypothetical protein